MINNGTYYKKIISICQKVYDESKANEKDAELLKTHPHIFVLGCIMDSQIPFEQAWNIPFVVSNALGGLDFSLFNSKDEQWYVDFFLKHKLHRFNENMAHAFYKAIEKIANQYEGDASKMWNDTPSSAELVYRFLEFDRVGIKIATMATNILSRDYKVKLRDYYAIDISPDIHVKRTMYRLGLLEKQDKIEFALLDATKIIYRAKSINPEFPGLMDLAFWQVGQQKICTNSGCLQKKCMFGDICKRQGL